MTTVDSLLRFVTPTSGVEQSSCSHATVENGHGPKGTGAVVRRAELAHRFRTPLGLLHLHQVIIWTRLPGEFDWALLQSSVYAIANWLLWIQASQGRVGVMPAMDP